MTRILLVFLLALSAWARSPSFEVASIKPNNSASGRSTESTTPGRLRAINVTASWLIQQAFGIKAFQISGGPGWLDNDYYDVNATTGTAKDLSLEELQPYLQSLLADRFHFTYHRETKEAQVYALTITRGEAKLTATHAGEGDTSANVSTGKGSGKASIVSTNVSMPNFAGLLSRRLDRAVIDHTGLKGGYDFRLEWAPNPAADSAEPSLFTALQEQLGLKLESTKSPVEIIVIDNIERPSEN